jgi:tetratricopeptide (TPR) repeat protein
MSRLASFQQATGRITDAEASVQEARQYIRLVESGEEIVHLHSKMAEIAKNYGQYEQARDLMTFSLQVANDINDEPQKARLLMLMGAMERDSGYFDRALDYMQQSMALYRQIEFDWGVAHTQRLTGGILLEQNELAEAAVCFQKALMLFQNMNDTIGATLVYREMGKLACERKNWSAADENFAQALKLAKDSSDIKGSALVYQDIGRYHLQRKRPQRARDYLLSCFQMATRIRDIPLVLESLLDIVRLQIALQSDTDADTLPDYLAELMSFVYVRARNQPLLRQKAHQLMTQHFPDDAPDRAADMVLTLDDLRDRVEQYVN